MPLCGSWGELPSLLWPSPGGCHRRGRPPGTAFREGIHRTQPGETPLALISRCHPLPASLRRRRQSGIALGGGPSQILTFPAAAARRHSLAPRSRRPRRSRSLPAVAPRPPFASFINTRANLRGEHCKRQCPWSVFTDTPPPQLLVCTKRSPPLYLYRPLPARRHGLMTARQLRLDLVKQRRILFVRRRVAAAVVCASGGRLRCHDGLDGRDTNDRLHRRGTNNRLGRRDRRDRDDYRLGGRLLGVNFNDTLLHDGHLLDDLHRHLNVLLDNLLNRHLSKS